MEALLWASSRPDNPSGLLVGCLVECVRPARGRLSVMEAHRLAEARSLAYHQVIADRLAEDPEILQRARARIAEWSQTRPGPYVDGWASALTGSVTQLARVMTSTAPEHVALRQCTPFAGALGSAERWAIWRAVRAAHR